uniref:Uncharacterized protein n=1 Tax=Anopheles merus TaxID=30066 RepID=A0A182VEQ5_ANOME
MKVNYSMILARCPRTVLITAVRAAGQVNQLLLLLLLIAIGGQGGDRCHRRQGRCGRRVRTGSCPNGPSTIDHKRDASTGIMRTITVSTVVNQNVASFIACVSEPTYGPPMT